MSNILNTFIEKKKAESPFVTLDDGESIKVLKLKEMKMITKSGFAGEEKEVLRLIIDVETSEGSREKNFDNGTQKFAQELIDNGVTIGSSFVITRDGLLTKTKYTISEAVNEPKAKTQGTLNSTPITSTTPVTPATPE